MTDADHEMLTVEDVRRILRIGTNNAYILVHSRVFPVLRIGGSYRIPKDSFYNWLRQGADTPFCSDNKSLN